MKRIGVVIILALAFFGLADSSYLASHAASGSPLICNIDNLSGCNIVAQSPYAHFLGVPLADFGLLFYGMVFVLAALELALFDRLLRRVLQGAAVVGFISSVYFVLVEVFLIKALCIYCLVSAAISVLILAFATLIEPVRGSRLPRSSDHPEPNPVPPPFSMPPSA
jgi:uncharacterized membrane protein